MQPLLRRLVPLLIAAVGLLGLVGFASRLNKSGSPADEVATSNASQMIEEGRRTFRFDTFGDEAFWGGSLRLHEAIRTVSPRTALGVGLKVDVDALPKDLQKKLAQGKVDLDDPAVTAELLRLNAVVGVTGFFSGGQLSSIGIQCALCHSTVDNSLAMGVGHRLDGWANRDLDIGTIVSLAPNLQPLADLLGVDVPTVVRVLQSWGPGKFDAALILDGPSKAFSPTGRSGATLIPPAFGLAGVNLHTWTGWGSVTHWNAFVSNLEMHGQGTFFDPRLDDASQFPIAARERFGHVRNHPDLITGKLAALHFYQLAIPAPRPPDGSFDAAAAATGKALFEGSARCAECHVPPLFTEPGWNMHRPEEVGVDAFQADRAPDHRYRTSPLKGLWTHTKGGFYHDGRFATLADVIDHYDSLFVLTLSDGDKHALEQYLLSLGDAAVPTGGNASKLGAAFDVEDQSSWVRLASPNPSEDATLELEMTRSEVVDFGVYDAAGRRIAQPIDHQSLDIGLHRVSWNGEDASGRRVPPGIYFVRVTRGNDTWSRRIVLLKR
jgi:hypothetical protein